MDVLVWLGRGVASDAPAAHAGDALWPVATLALSAFVAVGYGVIAAKWFLQSRLHSDESPAAAVRLRNIVLCCAVLGVAFFAIEPGWVAWRIYDAMLLTLGLYAWSHALGMRGFSLVDQRLAEMKALEETAERYREIAELLPQPVWTATADGQIDFSNQRWEEFAGRGTRHTWLDVIHPDERQSVQLWWRAAVATSREPVGREVVLRGCDGEYRTFIVRATPVVRGDAVRWLGACADIEDQKRLSAERESQARQKAFFLNALSHDLRAPLHNVVLNAHLLKMSSTDAPDLEAIDTIVENAVAAGDLVTRLLEYAKAGEERVAAPQRVAMGGLLRQIARRFQPAADAKGIQLRVEDGDLHNEDDVEILIDRQNLDRVISNLVDNAIKFTESGGVSLELSKGGSAMTVDDDGGDADDDIVLVRVRDSGIGIPPESVPFLFNEFYQVNNHERDRRKGFGIGLAICRSLARQLGGDVRLVGDGDVNGSRRGSCFEVSVKGIRARRRGRPDGPAGHRLDPEAAGLCRL